MSASSGFRSAVSPAPCPSDPCASDPCASDPCPPCPAGRLRLPFGAQRARPRILPIFLPFAGCPQRCLFCSQNRQTGAGRSDQAAGEKKNGWENGTKSRKQGAFFSSIPRSNAVAKGGWPPFLEESGTLRNSPTDPDRPLPELAFYGGTFTLLPEAEAWLDVARAARQAGRIGRIRASTRPDALAPPVLEALRGAGLDLLELGVQSFADAALTASRRGYSGEQARQGCLAVKEAGFELGVQLLPGMPGMPGSGSGPETFVEDVRIALSLGADCLRFYPCLVIEGTGLAELWQAGRYEPWDLKTTVSALGRGLALAWRAGVPVIRLSLAPQPELEEAVLAGPRHPALGSLVQAEALLLTVKKALADLPPPASGDSRLQLRLPRPCQGFFLGEGGALRPVWQSLGLPPERVIWTDGEADLAWIRR